DLGEAYDMADVVVNPRQFGTGLSIKSIEALSYGKPLVASPAGSSGMEDGAGTAFYLGKSSEALAEGIVRMLQDDALHQAFAAAGREYVVQHNRAIAQSLQSILGSR